MDRNTFSLICEGLHKLQGEEYVASCFADELTKLSLSTDDKLNILDAVFNKRKESKKNNFRQFSEAVGHYFAEHQATVDDTNTLLENSRWAHSTAKLTQKQVTKPTPPKRLRTKPPQYDLADAEATSSRALDNRRSSRLANKLRIERKGETIEK